MYITLQGYNDKMSVLVKHVLEKVKNLEVLPDRMLVMIEQVCFVVGMLSCPQLTTLTFTE